MTAEQLAAFKVRVEAMSTSLGIGMEAAALITELHDLADAFRGVRDALNTPHHYEMTTTSPDILTGEATYRFTRVPDA